MTRSAWLKLRVVRAICEAFAENIPQSMAIVQPLLAEVPCGDTWVDGLICNILSYCHVVNQRYAEALEVQRYMPCPESPWIICLSRFTVLLSSPSATFARPIWRTPGGMPKVHCVRLSVIPAPSRPAAQRWHRCWRKLLTNSGALTHSIIC